MVSKLSLTIIGTQCSGPAKAALRGTAVEIVGLLQRFGIGDDDGVDRRAVLVVGVDAAEILLDKSCGR